ncbi:MAG TPA: D-alanyl-D-alanine carboxypeptidase family protein [Allosphingosinicella sp.]|jgi:LAS superfamily LD-carboxypeptidase LdcB
MATDDVQRLVLQVDASVELARANLTQLARVVDQEGKKMDTALASVDQSHQRVGRSSNNLRISQMELMHVMEASTSAYNDGIPPLRIIAVEMGRVIESVELLGLQAGSFAKFIGGPWGIALAFGASVLASLFLNHNKAADGAKAHKDEEKSLADTIKEAADATKNLNDNELVTIQRHIDSARAAMQRAQAERALTQTLIEQAIQIERGRLQEQSNKLSTMGFAFTVPETGSSEQSIAAALKNKTLAPADADRLRGIMGNVSALTAELASVNAEIVSAQHSYAETEIKFAATLAEGLTSAETRARQDYERAQIALEQDFRKRASGRTVTNQDTNWLAQQEAGLIKTREAAIQRARDMAEAEKKLADNRQQGRQVTLAQAESIVKGIGGVITSAYRSPEKQAQLYAAYQAGRGPLAARPGTSYHERGQALDVAKTPGMSLGRLRQAFTAQGVSIRELLDEGNHYHVAFGQAGPSSETLTKQAEAAQQKQIRDDAEFEQAKDRANEQLLAAQHELGMSVQAEADLQVRQVETERDRANSAALAMLHEKKITQAQADQLIALNWEVSNQKTANIRARERDKLNQDELSIEEGTLKNAADLERARGQLAQTNAERRASALRLLDLSQQQERLELEATLASSSATDAQKKIAKARLDMLGALHASDVQAINQQYAGPGQQYLRSLDAQSLSEQFQAAEVDGLKGLEDGLTGVIDGTESLSTAFSKMTTGIIDDLARIALQEELIKPLARQLFGGDGSSGGSGGGGLLGGLLKSIFGGSGGAGGSVQGPDFGTLGAGLGDSGGGLGDLASVPDLSAYAAGGDPPVGMPSLVGEKGPEIFIPRVPGTIIPNSALRGAASRGGGQTTVYVVPSPYFDAHVDGRAQVAVTRAAPGVATMGASAAITTLSRRAGRSLPTAGR